MGIQKIIKYYQENKEEFFIDCLQSDENERQYLYNDWIEDYFETSTLNKCNLFKTTPLSNKTKRAIKNDFIENLIEEAKELHSFTKTMEDEGKFIPIKTRESYYASIGRYVCQELYASFEEDFEI